MTTGASTPTHPARPRRSRLRTFLPLGIAAWLVLEIWLLTVVAGASNGFVVFLLLLAGFVLGAVVIKRAGRRAFQNLNEALQRGEAPSDSRGGGNGLMMLGGLLLMLPGLVSDAVGLLLLVPPVQKAVSRYAERTFERKLRAAAPGTLGDAFQQVRIHRPDGKVVQGEVIRDEPGDTPQDPRPPLTR
ncbi:FxsA family protein [Streptomyces luteolifulvus]|uniref:FxsA family protein n=1 Tax=Streptomyces luteolifulvus TaxID=2615112 RepID=A0A6H9V614_9ACTN|nr:MULTISPECIES: FxsA family membrane protein [Streptomyces]KAB1150816.1 FxsA family protein [Streptomyces luteolifulvus]MXM67891.1 FxsA family protein [Streptomyces sp. HUCO-GS316]